MVAVDSSRWSLDCGNTYRPALQLPPTIVTDSELTRELAAPPRDSSSAAAAFQ
jgi:hypothetical protein